MLYAVATHPEDRGKGFSTMLMDYVNRDFLKRDFLSVLPATPSLFNFIKTEATRKALRFPKKSQIGRFEELQNPDLFMQPAEGKDYNRIRNRLLSDISFIQYFDEDIEFQSKSPIVGRRHLLASYRRYNRLCRRRKNVFGTNPCKRAFGTGFLEDSRSLGNCGFYEGLGNHRKNAFPKRRRPE